MILSVLLRSVANLILLKAIVIRTLEVFFIISKWWRAVFIIWFHVAAFSLEGLVALVVLWLLTEDLALSGMLDALCWLLNVFLSFSIKALWVQ